MSDNRIKQSPFDGLPEKAPEFAIPQSGKHSPRLATANERYETLAGYYQSAYKGLGDSLQEISRLNEQLGAAKLELEKSSEADAKIEDLKSQIATLESKIEELNNLVEDLKTDLSIAAQRDGLHAYIAALLAGMSALPLNIDETGVMSSSALTAQLVFDGSGPVLKITDFEQYPSAFYTTVVSLQRPYVNNDQILAIANLLDTPSERLPENLVEELNLYQEPEELSPFGGLPAFKMIMGHPFTGLLPHLANPDQDEDPQS